jgi:xanthine dehydrogenase accessory factor
MRNIYLHLPAILKEEEKYSIATVISTSGSTPQKPGNSALFSSKGRLIGTVGGGILEARCTSKALRNAETRTATLDLFDLNNSIKEKGEAICGGEATVLIDGLVSSDIQLFRKAADLLSRRIAAAIVTEITVYNPDTITVKRYLQSDETSAKELSAGTVGEAERLLKSGKHEGYFLSEVKKPGDVSFITFIEPIFPPPRLIIAGAGHIGRALTHYGRRLGFEITVADSRTEFASRENLPEADHIITGDIATAMAGIEADSDTFVVIVTHGHADDAAVLRSTVGKPFGYLGMIGSRKKVAKVRHDFIENGWADEETWRKIHAPIGVEIESKTVEEIAISIAAQLVLVRNTLKKQE